MGDIAQRGNKLTKKHISTDLVRNVYEHVARKHSLGQKGKQKLLKKFMDLLKNMVEQKQMKLLGLL